MSQETFVSDGYRLIEVTSYSGDEHERCLGIVGYTGSESEIVIPSKINGMPVIHIENFSFSGKGIVSVVIPEGVQYIGEKAFADCSSLQHLVAPSTVEEIAPNAFLGTPFVSRKILSGLSEHEELDRYWEWADWYQDEMLHTNPSSDIFGRKRWKRNCKKHKIVWQDRRGIEVALRKEKAFDENSAIDGFGFSFGGEQYVAITSFTDRPCWYWHVASCSPHEAWEQGTDWESREGTWDSQQAEGFFDELRSLRFFDWNYRYDMMVTDGYSWSTFVKFSNNGTYFYSSGYMVFPKNYKKFTKLLRRYGFQEIQD